MIIDRAKTLTSVKSTRIVVVSVSVSALTNRVVIRASAPKAIAYLPINEPVKVSDSFIRCNMDPKYLPFPNRMSNSFRSY